MSEPVDKIVLPDGSGEVDDGVIIASETEHKHRVNITYDEMDLDEREAEEHEVKALASRIRIQKKTQKIFTNQEKCATVIVTKLSDRKIVNILVCGLTQSGKTGTMVEVVDQYIARNMIPVDNIYIITGYSSKEWSEQTKERFPERLHKNIWMRTELKNLSQELSKKKGILKKNILIIVDEVQMAGKKGQTMNLAFELGEIYERDFIFNNDIKIVQFTATPDAHRYTLTEWGKHAACVKMEPGEGYISSFDLYKKGQVKQYKDLLCYDKKLGIINKEKAFKNIMEIQHCISEKYSEKKRYHIIRTHGGNKQKMTIDNFKEVFGDTVDYKNYDLNTHENINDITSTPPKKTTFIFIKDMLRCAKTLEHKENIGIVYERYVKSGANDTTIMQGLLGRISGYDKHDITCFTNVDSVIRYNELWESDFTADVQWKSNTTKKNGAVCDTHMSRINGELDETLTQSDYSSEYSSEFDSDSDDTTESTPMLKHKVWYGKEGQDKMKEFFKKELKPKDCFSKKHGPRNRHPIDGFYKAAGATRKGTTILTVEDVEDNMKSGLKKKSVGEFRSYPCYSDPTKPETLQWWLIWTE